MKKNQKEYNILQKILLFVMPTLILILIFLPNISIANEQKLGLVGCEGYNCNMAHFFAMIQRIINEAIKIAFAFVGVIFAYAGYTYMTAQGDSGKISKAHGMFTKAAIGLFITLSAYLIIRLVLTTLGADTQGELIIELVQ